MNDSSTVSNDPLQRPLARSGEQQFAVICRQRSGIDSGNICPVSRPQFIEELCDADQQDIVSSVLILAETCIRACKMKNRQHVSHLFQRISGLQFKEKI